MICCSWLNSFYCVSSPWPGLCCRHRTACGTGYWTFYDPSTWRHQKKWNERKKKQICIDRCTKLKFYRHALQIISAQFFSSFFSSAAIQFDWARDQIVSADAPLLCLSILYNSILLTCLYKSYSAVQYISTCTLSAGSDSISTWEINFKVDVAILNETLVLKKRDICIALRYAPEPLLYPFQCCSRGGRSDRRKRLSTGK